MTKNNRKAQRYISFSCLKCNTTIHTSLHVLTRKVTNHSLIMSLQHTPAENRTALQWSCFSEIVWRRKIVLDDSLGRRKELAFGRDYHKERDSSQQEFTCPPAQGCPVSPIRRNSNGFCFIQVTRPYLNKPVKKGLHTKDACVRFSLIAPFFWLRRSVSRCSSSTSCDWLY